MTIRQTGGDGTVRSPRLEVQVKCKAAERPVEDGFSFWVKKKNYDDLRDPHRAIPIILVVVLVPEDFGDWLRHNEHKSTLRRCAYWVSLRGMPASENATGQTVQIPRVQTLTVASLREMMERIGMKGLP